MEYKELRLGNMVLENDKNYTKTLLISNDYILTTSAGKQSLKPIPLTEEWLEKLGWKRVNKEDAYSEIGISEIEGDYAYYISGLFFITKNGDWNTFYHSTDEDTYWQIHHNIEHVHQLQNLYFCLCGKELNFIDND